MNGVHSLSNVIGTEQLSLKEGERVTLVQYTQERTPYLLRCATQQAPVPDSLAPSWVFIHLICHILRETYLGRGGEGRGGEGRGGEGRGGEGRGGEGRGGEGRGGEGRGGEGRRGEERRGEEKRV